MSGSAGWTPDMLAALRAQIAQGVLEVTHADGRRVRYASPDEALRAVAAIEADLTNRGTLSGVIDRSVSYTVFERD